MIKTKAQKAITPNVTRIGAFRQASQADLIPDKKAISAN
jgi:hypothetical protein